MAATLQILNCARLGFVGSIYFEGAADDEVKSFDEGMDLTVHCTRRKGDGVFVNPFPCLVDRGGSISSVSSSSVSSEEDAVIAMIDARGSKTMQEELNGGMAYLYANPPNNTWVRGTRNPAYIDHLPPRKQPGGSSPRLGLRVENGKSAAAQRPRQTTHSVSGKGVDVSALKLCCKSCKQPIETLPFVPKHSGPVNCTGCHKQQAQQPQQGGRRR